MITKPLGMASQYQQLLFTSPRRMASPAEAPLQSNGALKQKTIQDDIFDEIGDLQYTNSLNKYKSNLKLQN
jgi:hypothetical protein